MRQARLAIHKVRVWLPDPHQVRPGAEILVHREGGILHEFTVKDLPPPTRGDTAELRGELKYFGYYPKAILWHRADGSWDLGIDLTHQIPFSTLYEEKEARLGRPEIRWKRPVDDGYKEFRSSTDIAEHASEPLGGDQEEEWEISAAEAEGY